MANPGSTADENEIPTLAAGTILGKYSIVELLGAGGMGAVYEATHTEIGKRVAIKVLSPLIAAVPGARARFLREAQLTSRVRHPHIVDVADMGSDGGNTYLVMEFLHGEDLGAAARAARSGRRRGAGGHHAAGLLGGRGRARRRRHPPRPQAAEHLPRAPARAACSPRCSTSASRRGNDAVTQARDADRHRRDDRNAVLPRPRADHGQQVRGLGQRPVRARHHSLRVPDREAPLRRREPVRRLPGDRRRHAEAPARDAARDPPRDGGGRAARDEGRPEGALRDHRGLRPRAAAVRVGPRARDLGGGVRRAAPPASCRRGARRSPCSRRRRRRRARRR